jgi:CRP-like cAMP-binding protein
MKSLERFPFDQFKFSSDSFFKGLSDEELAVLNIHIKTRLYKKKQIIFFEGSPSIGVYFIKEGLVKKYKTGNDGKEHVFYLSKAGDLIGYHAILSNEYYFDSAAAVKDSVISFIPKEVFLEILKKSPALSNLLIKTISHEFGVMINNWTIRSNMSVRERLALNLLILKDKFKETGLSKEKRTEIVIPREDLASLVGTATENLVRLLHEFKESKLIETKGKAIVILNIKELVKISKF